MKTKRQQYRPENYNCVVKEDISRIVGFFLEDLKSYNEENNIVMSDLEIQKCINLFMVDYLPSSKDYFSEKDIYEEITDTASSEYFDSINYIVLLDEKFKP